MLQAIERTKLTYAYGPVSAIVLYLASWHAGEICCSTTSEECQSIESLEFESQSQKEGDHYISHGLNKPIYKEAQPADSNHSQGNRLHQPSRIRTNKKARLGDRYQMADLLGCQIYQEQGFCYVS
tara:strand:+ start:645 stop:1019 length:375 start_codon:yes stop_codon:yes gene_type:complete